MHEGHCVDHKTFDHPGEEHEMEIKEQIIRNEYDCLEACMSRSKATGCEFMVSSKGNDTDHICTYYFDTNEIIGTGNENEQKRCWTWKSGNIDQITILLNVSQSS